MLTKMKLGNFKSWRELDLDLAPITLLFGTNSSGKTSILQALLLLKQTAASFDRKQHINFGGSERDYVDLGSYRDLVFGHEESQPINFRLESYTDIVLRRDRERRKPRDNKLAYTVEWHTLNDDIVIDQLDYDVLSPNDQEIFIHMRRTNEDKYVIEASSGETTPISGSIEPSGLEESLNEIVNMTPESCYRIPSPRGVRFSLDFNPYMFSRAFEKIMDSIIYLGPLRNRPERAYLWTGAAPQEIGPNGENTIGMLLASKRQRSNGQNLLGQVSDWLARLGLVSEFQIEAIDRDKRFYEPRVKVNSEGAASSLLDTGFGISQVLPVVTMVLSAPEGSIVLIEQPELHLHPSAQAQLADLFLEVAEKRNLQLIIESHSEHLLRRLQRRIAETDYAFANPDNIKMYFCHAGAKGSEIQRVEVDKYGQIANWPENFFGDVSGDLDKMMDAAINRRRQELSLGD